MRLYKIVFDGVSEIVNSHDPVGLIAGGAPLNEYHDSVNHIVELLRDSTNEGVLKSNIQAVFEEKFGSSLAMCNPNYTEMAADLLDYARKVNWCNP